MRNPHLCVLIAVAAEIGWAQIGGPQYPPGGGYPGSPGRSPQPQIPSIPRPSRGKKNKKDAKAAEERLQDLRGVMRRVTETELVLEASDKRILRIGLGQGTKFLKSAAEMNVADIQAGDHLFVEASQDDQGRYYAARVNWEKAGTAAERAAAQSPVDEAPAFGDDDEKPEQKTRDGERPILRRADSPKPAESKKSPPASAPTVDPAEPPPGRSVIMNPQPSPDSGDEGPPRLARGRPVPRQGTVEIAEARDAAANPAEAIPDPPPVLDPFMEKARETSESFVETLPNYMVKQITTRYISTTTKPNWMPQDNISTDLVYENGKESYRNVLLNGKPAKGKVQETGSWSTGEFGTILKDVFARSTAADFRSRGAATMGNRNARVFDFTVEQPNSHWHVYVPGQSYRPAYKGKIWVDKETARVLRVEMQTRNMPRDFPLDTVESATDYEFVRLGEGTYLLPVHSETLNCVRGTTQCSRNVIEFRNYKKFGAESNITFTPEKKD